MGWCSSYKIHLYSKIQNFDYDYVDEWCSEQDTYYGIDYGYNDPLVVYVEIKYGKHEIENVFDMLVEKFCCSGYITVEDTDETEWPDWRRDYSG